jgi:hypothetical protein
MAGEEDLYSDDEESPTLTSGGGAAAVAAATATVAAVPPAAGETPSANTSPGDYKAHEAGGVAAESLQQEAAALPEETAVEATKVEFADPDECVRALYDYDGEEESLSFKEVSRRIPANEKVAQKEKRQEEVDGDLRVALPLMDFFVSTFAPTRAMS